MVAKVAKPEKLTPNQEAHLLKLLDLKAFTPEKAVVAVDHHYALSTGVLGKLRDYGLAESRSREQKRRRWTEYYLTEAGAKRAIALRT